MRLFTFRKPAIHSIYILTYCLFNILLYFFEKEKVKFEHRVVIDHYITSFSQLLSVIFVIIVKIRTKNIKKDIQMSIDQTKKIENTSDKVLKISEMETKKEISFFIPYIFLTDFILLIAIFLSKIQYGYKNYKAYIFFTPTYFITTCIMCYFCLNNRIFRHHLLGIIIMILGSLFTINAVLEEENDYKLIKTLKIVFWNIFYGSFFVLIKKVIEKFSNRTHYEILLFIGLINLVYCLILSFILQFIKNKDYDPEEKEKKTYWRNAFGNHEKLFQWDLFKLVFEKKIYILHFIILILLRFGLYFSIVSIIKNYSPLHCIIADTIYVLIRQIVKFFKGEDDFSWQAFTSLIIMIFASLIYIEIIVFHFWGLDENTYLNIMDRADEDKLTRMSRIDFFVQEFDQTQKEDNIEEGNGEEVKHSLL